MAATLLNQRQLATAMGCSRQTIIAWERDGMPVHHRGGPGRKTLYDLDAARAWCARTGRSYTYQAVVARARRVENAASAAVYAHRQELDEDDERVAQGTAWAIEGALLAAPRILTELGLAEAAVRQFIDRFLEQITRELGACGIEERLHPEISGGLRERFTEEMRSRGTWTA